MDKIVVKGGARLRGDVRVSGAKNAALPILASALLARGASIYRNVPDLGDVRTMKRLLAALGAGIDDRGKASYVQVDASTLTGFDAPRTRWSRPCAPRCWCWDRCSARQGEAVVSLPGGCAIGARPIDQHLKGLEALGAKLTLEHGNVRARARRLRGRDRRVRRGDRHRAPRT